MLNRSELKSIHNRSTCNSPFKDSHSQPIHTCFPVIADNDNVKKIFDSVLHTE